MKPRNFYLFVALLALWMAWATAFPAWLLAVAGHDDYDLLVSPVWAPEVPITVLGLDERTTSATGRAIVESSVMRTRIQDRIGETMGGFHWHGLALTVVSVRTADGTLLRYRLDKGSPFAKYLYGEARLANGDPLFESWEPRSGSDCG